MKNQIPTANGSEVPTVNSPTTCLHCNELECAVKISSTSTGLIRGCIQSKAAVVTLGRNVKRQIILQVLLSKVQGVSHVSYLLKDCVVHGKMIKRGCGSIEIPSKHTAIFLSNCPPRRLNVFLKTLDAKLALINNSINANVLRTPLGVLKNEMLSGLPNVFEKLSPLAVEEIRQLRRLRNKSGGRADSPLSSKLQISKLDNSTPRPAVKRRPLRDIQHAVDSDTILSPKNKISKQSELLLRLTDEQKGVVRAVLERKNNVFFTGSAGTGKSLVLASIIELLPAATTFITASTGVAACFIGGITLHSFAGIGNGLAAKDQCVEMARKKFAKAQWKNCQHLIIDEISMIDADYFEKLEYVARKIRNNDEPFGGIQLIITGDFLQLPPVVKNNETPRFCFQSEAWRRCINQTFLLRQVKRQTDSTFVDILQQIRVGRCSQSLIDKLTATRLTNFSNFGVIPTRLCTHTADVDLVNKEHLDALKGEEKVFLAKDSFFVSETRKFIVVKRLVLKVGAQVMLMKNLDLHRGLSNGSRGVVVSFSSKGFPVVRFLASTSESIEVLPVKFHFRLPESESPLLRLQVPLQLAWAVSIHKSQGLTLDCVELSLSRVFAEGQVYVALSRARSLDSVRLIDFDPLCIKANADVIRYYDQLNSSTFQTVRSRSRVALFHNKPRSLQF